jgi:hypothetical protein
VLWKNLFPNAVIHGIDIQLSSEMHPEFNKIQGKKEIEITIDDAYQFTKYVAGSDFFDVIIDDGPHTLESQIRVLTYRNLLNKQGVLIIEDVPKIAKRLREMKSILPKKERQYLNGYSFALQSGRYDDSIIVYSRDVSLLKWINTSTGLSSRALGESRIFFGVLRPLFVLGRIRRFVSLRLKRVSSGTFCK